MYFDALCRADTRLFAVLVYVDAVAIGACLVPLCCANNKQAKKQYPKTISINRKKQKQSMRGP